MDYISKSNNQKVKEMKRLTLTIVGKNELRLSNPQAVDPLNQYSIRMKAFTDVHHSRRDEQHYLAQRDLEYESKLYWNDELGVYIPSSWIMESIAKESFAQVKVAKAKMRGAVFMTTDKIKLHYNGENTVNSKMDVIHNQELRATQPIKQGQVRIIKVFPKFTGWSINVELDFDERIFTEQELKKILSVAVARNGFGDFRPTYGTGHIENWNVVDTEEVA